MRDPAPLAVVAGHICLDIMPDLSCCAAKPAQALLMPGKLLNVGPADVHTGGCVANTGLALQKLGIATRLVARVGADAFGDMVQERLAAEGADCALIRDPDAATSYSVVLAPPGVDRMFLHHSGANERFVAGDLPDEVLRDATLLHFGYPPMMTGMLAHRFEGLVQLFTRARALGVSTSMDMAAIDPDSPVAGLDWAAALKRLIPLTDFSLPSAEELCFMLDKPRWHEWRERAAGGDITETLNLQRDIDPLIDQLMALGARVVLVKCGVSGIAYRTAPLAGFDGFALPGAAERLAGRGGFQPSFVPRRVVSATGAGDTSIAAFLTSVLAGCTLERSVQRAAATGACCVEAADALGGLMSIPELDLRIAEGWATRT